MTEPTSQLGKLGIVPGARWSVVDADAGWAFEEAPDPEQEAASGPADVIVAFARTPEQVRLAFEQQEPRLPAAGALWIGWPRRAAGHVSELGDAVVREVGLSRGLVDVKVAALDHDWSALKFVRRRADR